MAENKIYTVNVEYGSHTGITFDAIILPSTDNTLQLCRFGEVAIQPNRGALRIDFDEKKIGAIYDIFTITAIITKTEEVIGNYHLECSNDLFNTIHVYICEKDTWLTQGKSIFHSQADPC